MEFCRGLFGMPPAAPFLGRQEMEERTGQRGFPLCDSPTPVGNSTRSSARLATCLRTARYRLDVRVPTTSWRVPSHGIARRRCRCIPRFDPTLEGSDEGATEKAPCRSCPKRDRDYPIAAHEVKRRPQMICRAHDGVQSLVTRAGSQRAEPFGVSFVQPFSARAEKGWPPEA